MAYWWSGDENERYWVEIRTSLGIGRELWSPDADERGRTNGFYELVASVRRGDVIYHWNAREHRFVGRSEASSDAVARDGTYRVPLNNFTPIDVDISLARVRMLAEQLYAVRDELSSRYGKPLYLPFQFKQDRTQISFMSNYFTKLPKKLVSVLFGDDEMAGGSEFAEIEDLEESESSSRLFDHHTVSRRGFLRPFKPKADTEYQVSVIKTRRRRTRLHESLVNYCADWLTAQGFSPACNAAIDLGLEQPPVVIEAKIISRPWQNCIREAVGQLYEYRYFQVAATNSTLIVLADREVPFEWLTYLERDRVIGTMWPTGTGFCGSRIASESLGIR